MMGFLLMARANQELKAGGGWFAPGVGAAETAPNSTTKLWIGRVMSGLVVAFLLMDSVMKFIKPAAVTEACAHLGLPESSIAGLGAILLACTVLYALPLTSVFGAVLLTGYLGGAVAVHMRIGDSLFGQMLFPVYLGVFLWAGLYLRDERVQGLFATRRRV